MGDGAGPTFQPGIFNSVSLMEGESSMAKKKTQTKAKVAKKSPASKTPAKPKGAKTAAPKQDKKLSCLDAAAKVLAESKGPMTCKELIEAMATKALWKSPRGQTPDRTVYSAILREIAKRGKDARFTKTERGKFAAKG